MNGQYEISKPDYPEPAKYEHNQCGFSLKDYDLLYFMRSYSLHERRISSKAAPWVFKWLGILI